MCSHDELVDGVDEITRNVCGNILALEAEPRPPALDVPCTVTGSVQIVGGWRGAVQLTMSSDLAALMAGVMFEAEPDTLSPEEIDDVVGEMANMIGGNVKALVDGPSELSLPTVTNGTQPHFPGSTVVARREFAIAGEPFDVTVFEARDGLDHTATGTLTEEAPA